MADKRLIHMSATEFIANFPGRKIERSMIACSYNRDSVQAAQDAVRNWAGDNGFEAVVGVRFVPTSVMTSQTGSVPESYHGSGVSMVGGSTRTAVQWTCFGTAIQWAGASPDLHPWTLCPAELVRARDQYTRTSRAGGRFSSVLVSM